MPGRTASKFAKFASFIREDKVYLTDKCVVQKCLSSGMTSFTTLRKPKNPRLVKTQKTHDVSKRMADV